MTLQTPKSTTPPPKIVFKVPYVPYYQCCDPTVYGTVDGNTVRYRNYSTPPYFVRFSQIWDRITVDYGTVYGTVHNFPRLR